MKLKLLLVILVTFIIDSCIAPDISTGTDPIRDSGSPYDEIWIINNLAETVSLCNGYKLSMGDAPWIAQNCLLTGSVPNRLYFYNGLGYIVNSYGNSLTVLNPNTAKTISSIHLGTGHNPWAAAFINKSGIEYAIISCFISDKLLVLNLDTKTIITEIPISPPSGADYRARPEGIAIMGNKAYFTCTGWDFNANTFREGFLGILDISPNNATNWSTITYITTATNPQSILPVPSRDEIHILATGINSSNDGVIQVYNITSNMIVTNIRCGGSPHRFALAADGTTYLAGSSRLLSYNRYTLSLINTWTNPLYSGNNDTYIPAAAVDTNNNHLYIADFGRDRILQLDPVTGSIIKESPSGDGPLDLVYRRQY